MLTKKIADFSADLLDTVRGVLGEAKKCPADCECEKCEAEEDDEDEDEMKKEGYMPTADEPTEANKKTAQKIRDMMAKEKKPVKEGTKEDLPFEGPYRKAGEERKDEYGNKVKNVAKHLAKKAMKANEEAEHTNCGTPECCGQCDTPEQIDEISKATMGRYINKAKDSIDMASYRQGEHHGDIGSPRYNKLEKKLSKRHKGIETAVKKLTKEESENLDELSKATMGRYINKAATKMGSQGVTAGLKIAADEKSSKNFKDMGKREKGIKLAVNKLTKEEQDFIDSLNNDMFEEVEITEARGRPRKGVAKDFTIHPRTKEKLMHNNPEHMKKIEVLQKNKVLPKPKVEADEHIMNQLQKAKTSMLGGSKINFTHGDSKHVSGQHAAKILTKYAGMKPTEKEAFQKFVGHSHENLMKHV